MAKKLVVRSNNDEVWVIDLDTGNARELKDPERTTMVKSLTSVPQAVGVQNAILGDDITDKDGATGHEKIQGP